jgi:hypothetical protein
MKHTIRIGNAGGFWGDDLNALRRQLEGGQLDYITADYLAEITMSILRKQQMKNPALGYVSDFVDQVDDVALLLKEKKVKLIVNAGGINPVQCAVEIHKRLKAKNVAFKIAVVEGDNIIDELDSFYPDSTDFKNMESGEDFSIVKDRIQSANVYLGVPPLLKALEMGAEIIIAGRVTDTSITMAPMIHEFGWKLNDWDKLASGLIAGHIIECGAQGSGGNYTDWKKVKRWDNFGYPIVEVHADGHFYVTKHENTGGLVSVDTVKEQLVYEMGEPGYYISPDVIVDFRSIHLEDVAENRVKVTGVTGRPSTHFLKVSMAYYDGYKAVGSIIISGGNALEKAMVFNDIFWKRLGLQYERCNYELVGYNACHKNLAAEIEPNEILLRFSVFDNDKEKINEYGKNIAPIILSGPPGVAVTGGRPRLQNVMTYWPALIPKELINTRVCLIDENGEKSDCVEVSSLTGFEEKTSPDSPSQQIAEKGEVWSLKGVREVKLIELCLARSGDKGDMANIGVIARNEKIYQFLKKYLTAAVVKGMFLDLGKGDVIRFELDNICALNFLLENSLDGGGTRSLMIDAQGKTFASALLNQTITMSEDVYNELLGNDE